MRIVISILIGFILIANMYALTIYTFFGSQIGNNVYHMRMAKTFEAENKEYKSKKLNFYEKYITYNKYGSYWIFLILESMALSVIMMWFIKDSYLREGRFKIVVIAFLASASIEALAHRFVGSLSIMNYMSIIIIGFALLFVVLSKRKNVSERI